jgi:hypothetical protein
MSPNRDLLAGMPIETISGRRASCSPLIDPATLADHGASLPAPTPHTVAELATLLDLVSRSSRRMPGVTTVSVGHSRDAASRDAARAFMAEWSAHGQVVSVVDWPETAASWLRPATRLTAQAPEAWVIAAAPVGFAQLARRLQHLAGWDPVRTVGFASLQDSRLPLLAGPDTLRGMRGATQDGGTWQVRQGWVVTYPPVSRPPAPPGASTGAVSEEGRGDPK